MSIVQVVGFDTGSTDEFVYLQGTGSLQNTITKSPGYALKINPTTSAASYAIFNRVQSNGNDGGSFLSNDLYSRFYFRVDTLPASGAEEIYSAVQGGGSIYTFAIRLNSAGKLDAYNSAQTKVASGTTVLTTTTWYLVEVHTQAGTTGVYELKINSVSEWSGTTNQTATRADTLYLGKQTDRSSQSVVYYYDNFIVSDSNFLGAGTTTLLVPVANGTYQNWSIGAGSGSHYQVVNEVPPDQDTGYLKSTGLNAETEVVQTRAQAGISVGTVNAVKGAVYATKDGASNGSISTRLRSNTTDSTIAAHTTAFYAFNYNLLVVNPATSASWVAADLDTLEIGSLNASANQSRMTAAYIYVDYGPIIATFVASSFNANIGTGF